MIKNSFFTLLLLVLAIQVTVAQGGSSCSEAVEAQVGTNVSDNFDGDQWFTYTATITGKVTVSSVGQTTANTLVKIYDGCDEEPFTFSDDFKDQQSEVTFEVIEGLSYLINWSGDHTATEYNWTLSEDEISEGEACSEPIVVTGESFQTYAPTNKYRWYQYTATKTGKITVTATGDNSDSCRVAIFDDCSNSSTLNNDESWNASKITFDAQEGTSYLICWQNGSDSDSIEWTVEEGDWQTGERCSDAIDVDASSTNFVNHESATSKWYKFTPGEDTEMTVSSVALTTEDTYLEVYEGCGKQPVAFSDDADDLQSEITMSVTGGKTYYIKWNKLFRPQAYAWNLTTTSSSGVSTGIENSETNGTDDLKLYPNPTTGQVNVDLSSYDSGTVVAVITGVSGSVVGMKRLTGGVVNTFDVSNLKSGVYQIMFTDLTSRKVVRLVKE